MLARRENNDKSKNYSVFYKKNTMNQIKNKSIEKLDLINQIEEYWALSERNKDFSKTVREYPKNIKYFSLNETRFIENSREVELCSWSKILYEGIKTGMINQARSLSDIVNKYGRIVKNTSYHKTAPRNWLILAVNNTLVKNLINRRIIVREKFPYDAAEYFVKRNFVLLENYNVTVIEISRPFVFHNYKVSKTDYNEFQIHKVKQKK